MLPGQLKYKLKYKLILEAAHSSNILHRHTMIVVLRYAAADMPSSLVQHATFYSTSQICTSCKRRTRPRRLVLVSSLHKRRSSHEDMRGGSNRQHVLQHHRKYDCTHKHSHKILYVWKSQWNIFKKMFSCVRTVSTSAQLSTQSP